MLKIIKTYYFVLYYETGELFQCVHRTRHQKILNFDGHWEKISDLV